MYPDIFQLVAKKHPYARSIGMTKTERGVTLTLTFDGQVNAIVEHYATFMALTMMYL